MVISNIFERPIEQLEPIVKDFFYLSCLIEKTTTDKLLVTIIFKLKWSPIQDTKRALLCSLKNNSRL